MKKKQSEYQPLFNYDDSIEDTSKKNEMIKCKKCGKPSVSLHKGVCFTCREKESSVSDKTKTTEESATELDNRKSNIRYLVFMALMFGLFIIFLVIGLLWMGGILDGPVFEKLFVCIGLGFFSAFLYVLILHEALENPSVSLIAVGSIVLLVVNIILLLYALFAVIAFEFILGLIVLAFCKMSKSNR